MEVYCFIYQKQDLNSLKGLGCRIAASVAAAALRAGRTQ